MIRIATGRRSAAAVLADEAVTTGKDGIGQWRVGRRKCRGHFHQGGAWRADWTDIQRSIGPSITSSRAEKCLEALGPVVSPYPILALLECIQLLVSMPGTGRAAIDEPDRLTF